MLSELFADCEPDRLLGILLNEVGNMTELLDTEGKMRLEAVLNNVFERQTGNRPQFFWNDGETMAVFRADVHVQELSRLCRIPRMDSWKVLERFYIHDAVEHGSSGLLIYNTHQPQSKERLFGARRKLAMCKAVVCDAIHTCNSELGSYGYVSCADPS